MPPFQDDLQAAIGPAYTLERELGGGGMSRVFVAEEVALHRKVAIKVLPPDLAAVLSPDRFRREIELAARLQHPHIVPLLAAGRAESMAGGAPLLYYTMPLVEGESLRARLSRDGAVPVAASIKLLREVADALAYAHARNVIHRDIKPDNILISSQHALVTDFGIAKAIGGALDNGSAGLTSVGFSLGTPAYMAPEQALADPLVDFHADLYAWGVVAYEMLTGQELFPRRSPQQIVAAHLTEVPQPIGQVVPSCPPALAALIMQSLEKEPGRRPKSAADIVARLDDIAMPTPMGTPSVALSPGRKRSRLWIPVAIVLVIAVAVTLRIFGLLPGSSLLSQGVFKDRDRILLADVVNHTRDSLLGGTVTEALRVDLTQSQSVSLLTAAQVQAALERMKRAGPQLLDGTLAREIAQREGAKAVVAAEVSSVGGGYVVSAQLLAASSGDVLAAFRETARDSSGLIDAIGKVSSQLRRRIGESLENIRSDRPLAEVSTSSLSALQKYSEAVRLIEVEGDYTRAGALLEEAVRIDTAFAMAWRKLGANLGNMGELTRASIAIAKAYQYRDRLPERERYMTMGSYFTRVRIDNQKALDAFQNLLVLRPSDGPALHNTALIYGIEKQYDQAIKYYRRAIEADSLNGLTYPNLVSEQLFAGQIDSADRTLQALRQKLPGNQAIPWSAYNIASARWDTASAVRILDSIRLRTADDPGQQAAAVTVLAEAALARGQLDRGQRQIREVIALVEKTGATRRALSRSVWQGTIDIWYRGDRTGGLATLDAAERKYGADSLAVLDQDLLDRAMVNVLGGRLDRARLLVARFEKIEPDQRKPLEASYLGVLGNIAMAEGKHAEAVARLVESVRLDDCVLCGMPDLARAYDGAGQVDSAIAVYQRYLTTPDGDRFDTDNMYLGPSYFRLAQLYEIRHEMDKARDSYTTFIALWKDADPELQPRVAEARKRLAALSGEP
ncbi:MAG: protein kinase, partial [Gemmatimonadota bacterium]